VEFIGRFSHSIAVIYVLLDLTDRILAGTLRENILLGVDPSTVTDEQLHQVCRDAGIHDFIISLPEGYNSNIGSRGVTLSGGQKQRVAIARAIIRNPRVLLLDEATSSLDSESEKLVQVALERAAQGRTTIAVAHRLATIQRAQVIFVLAEGRILEVGSHAELLKKKGVYWHMVSSQPGFFLFSGDGANTYDSARAKLSIDSDTFIFCCMIQTC
jgi:ATP-binding cassette, subfamily B (MDR/TAP), member 1